MTGKMIPEDNKTSDCDPACAVGEGRMCWWCCCASVLVKSPILDRPHAKKQGPPVFIFGENLWSRIGKERRGITFR